MEDCIIYSLDHDPPLSPPRTLLPLMLTCRRFYKDLHPSNNPRLYRRIFRRKFDLAAIVRRFPPSCIVDSRHFHPELKKRFLALRCIKLGDIHDPRLENAFLTTYIMLLEHDTLNHDYLVDAGLPALLDRYIAERLHRGPNDWPTEDTCNVLAVALFWHMTSQDALNGESIDSRNEVMDILLPLTFAWFRYSFIEQGFDPFVFIDGGSSASRLSSPTHPSPVTVPIDYMGHAFCLRLPAITLSASLAYFARLDAFPLVPPPRRALPREQSQSRIDGWTVEDIELYNSSFRTRTIPRGPGLSDSPSTCHDWDWLRAVAGDPFMSDSVRRYTPGILTGKWRGTELAPYDNRFTRFMTDDKPELPGQSRVPFSCCLEEHVRYSRRDGRDSPCHISLFPPTSWTRKEGGMELVDKRSSAKVFYRTLTRESSPQEPEMVQRDPNLGATADQEIVDVILSGRTEHHLQPAWEFSGRVRISDGLVVLVRQPVNGKIPRHSIYAGYLLSSQNFVGKWKYCNPDVQWEGIWTLCKAG